MAEVLLRRRLAERGVSATVRSAGLMPGGVPPADEAIAAMAAAGLDLSGRRSHQVSGPIIESADLIIAMTRQHIVELTLITPDAWAKMFQIRDLVRRAELLGARPPAQSLGDWVAAVGEGRSRAAILTSSLTDDVADPIGQPAPVYERTAQLLDDLLTRLVRLL